MVALFDYESFFDDTPSVEDEAELDLTFLEAIESSENLFGINKSFYESLESLKPSRKFVPTLNETVFEEPIHHAVWTSTNWPQSSKHFPSYFFSWVENYRKSIVFRPNTAGARGCNHLP
ncbi:MAG: hypothetical protein U0R17_01280 [Acidimicrobiia bacterium]